MYGLSQIVEELNEFPAVLATIIDVKGSSYRKEGAMMLCKQDGTHVGLLSGGCLEHDVIERAKDVLKRKTPISFVYDMKSEDDLGWGQGSGCNGTITVRLEFVSPQLCKDLKRVQHCLNEGIPVFHIKNCSESGEEYIFVTPHHQIFGKCSKGLEAKSDRLLAAHKKNIYFHQHASGPYFSQIFTPKPRLIIFGAGPDVRPLAALASQTGFYMMITDWRPAFCQKSNFPDADEIIIESPSAFIRKYPFSPHDYVIIMTHHFQKDQEILTSLLHKKLNYIGILGPRKRTYRLLEQQEIPNGIHSPIGLSIGAEGPEEIAISILAEVIQAVRKRGQDDCWNLFSRRTEPKDGVS